MRNLAKNVVFKLEFREQLRRKTENVTVKDIKLHEQ